MRNLPPSANRPTLAATQTVARPVQIRLTAMMSQLPPDPIREPGRFSRGAATPPIASRAPLDGESLLRHASLVGYITLDKYGKIVRINECGAILLGASRGVLLGQPFQQYVAAEERTAFDEFSKTVFNTDNSCECQMTLLRIHPQSKFRAQVGAVAVRRKGDLSRCLLTIIDISDLSRRTRD